MGGPAGEKPEGQMISRTSGIQGRISRCSLHTGRQGKRLPTGVAGVGQEGRCVRTGKPPPFIQLQPPVQHGALRQYNYYSPSF